ncbi:MAG: class I SAM-dependent methyltransferase [bacterium]
MEPKNPESWWQDRLGEHVSLETFASWLGDVNAPSRMMFRRHVVDQGYESVLDVPCGLCIDFFGFQEDGIQIRYQGLDVTPKLVDRAVSLGVPVQRGSIEAIPFEDASFDVCHSRHILEHLESYEKALPELIRVARNEVFVVFFIRPSEDGEDWIHCRDFEGHPVYENRYSRPKLETFLKKFPKIDCFGWEVVSEYEEILHLYLQPKNE